MFILMLVLRLISYIPIVGAIIAMPIMYYIDKSKENASADSFKRSGLFTRYGTEIFSSETPIQIDHSKTSKRADELVAGLTGFLLEAMESQFTESEGFRFQIGERDITDLQMKADCRKFLMASFQTQRNSKLQTVIYIPVFGNQIIVHQMIYLRGNYKWYNVIGFWLTSMVSIWFWRAAWFRGELNLINKLSSRFSKSAFDYLDMMTIFKSITVLIQTHLLKYARENDLLTDEIEKMIVQNINNSQNININQSKGVNFGNVSSSAGK